MNRIIKRVIVWAIRRAIQAYPDEAFTPRGTHLHRNPRRKPKAETYSAKNVTFDTEAISVPQGVPESSLPNVKPRLITVCDKCLQASCWQGVFMCQESQNAGTLQYTETKLKAMNLEHSSYWKTDQELADEKPRPPVEFHEGEIETR